MAAEIESLQGLEEIRALISEPAFVVLRESLSQNGMDPLRALGGLCEAYVAQQREISAGYSRRRS